MSETLVELKDIGRTYLQGSIKVEALKSATCFVLPKDRIAVVGASGSGKSTLLHIMGNLDSQTYGEIVWPLLNEDIPLRPSQIGFVFQMQSLIPTLSVLENIKLPLLLADQAADSTEKTALEVLERIELEDLKDKLPDELSGGQLQRVAVARALAAKPKLILADEPTGQLDHPTAKHLLDILLDYIDDSDAALVVSTHDMAVAERMKTHWFMSHGILEVKS
jgi:ABC-type lipoprotein export system ATPase subunit